ncbi:MAG: N-acetylmuramoyl-L-alanine amidase [Planctomycetes bacterium]|nr:N-acetylmuramoyl-L-alanine amidase [Planctomycetota bacterium]
MARRHGKLAWATALAVVTAIAFAGCRNEPRPVCPPTMRPFVADASIPIWRPVVGRRVILDPGHGGKDEGAAHHGLREKDITLDLARRTAERLRAAGVTVVLTREEDVFLSLAERSAFANSRPGALFVSIHVNAVDNVPDAAGVETFILTSDHADADRIATAVDRFAGDPVFAGQSPQTVVEITRNSRAGGTALAAAVQRSLVERLGERDRGVKTANLAVLRETFLCPAILVEAGFLSHPATARRMREDEWRRRTAEAIGDGIIAFLRQPE